MAIFRVKRKSALGLVLTSPTRYKTREAAQKAADKKNATNKSLYYWYVTVETDAERDVADAFATLRRTGRFP